MTPRPLRTPPAFMYLTHPPPVPQHIPQHNKQPHTAEYVTLIVIL
jgi:hypothetical protein